MKIHRLIFNIHLMVLSFCSLCTLGNAQIFATKTDVTCHGKHDGSIYVSVPNATAPIQYAWSDGFSGQNRINIAAGTYTVTVTDATACDHTKTVVIEEPDSKLVMTLELLETPRPYECHTPIPVYYRVGATGGTPPYTIQGQRGINHKVIRFGSTTDFTFSVSDDHGCREEKKRHILVGQFLCAYDPNDIAGPSGYGPPQWVSIQDTLPYTVRFENDPNLASAPAKQVFISHDFDEDINPYTFRLGTFGFGDLSFDVPVNASSFQKRYDLITEYGFYVDVVAGLDVQNRRGFWQLTTIDPLTNQQPTDPLIGFLPINDTLTHSGEGFVTFSVKAKSNTMTGDTVQAIASIIFDDNDPIVTNTWSNLIDAFPPTTILESLDTISEDNILQLSWSGTDDPGGSGLGSFEIFVSKDEGPYVKALVTVADSLTHAFVGEYGSHYRFYIIGIDNTGNREVKDSLEANVFILPKWEINIQPAIQDVFCIQDTINLDYSTIMADRVNFVMTIDSGETFITLVSNIDTSMHPFSWVLPDSLAGLTVRFFVIATDSTLIQDTSQYFLVRGFPVVDAGDDLETCPGELHYLNPDGANTYYWYPQIALNFQESSIQALLTDTSTLYFVTGTDEFGCVNTDSIMVNVHPTSLDTLIHMMCNQDSIFVGGSYQTEAGFYTDELSSVFGCDSTVVTEVILTGPCTFPSPQVYVDKDATGLNNGTSWANAFVELKDALEAAREWANADEIWIAEGIYSPHPTRRDTSFILHDSISIYGGFIGVELTRAERTNDPELVQISGDINIADTLSDNSYHTLVLTDQCLGCVVDGVTITYGHADLSSNGNDSGAGVLNFGTGHFFNVIFERNYATDQAAALLSTGNTANLIIENCIFRLNTSSLGKDVVNLAGAQVEFRGANGIH